MEFGNSSNLGDVVRREIEILEDSLETNDLFEEHIDGYNVRIATPEAARMICEDEGNDQYLAPGIHSGEDKYGKYVVITVGAGRLTKELIIRKIKEWGRKRGVMYVIKTKELEAAVFRQTNWPMPALTYSQPYRRY